MPAIEHTITSDGVTCWVNGPEFCLGRYTHGPALCAAEVYRDDMTPVLMRHDEVDPFSLWVEFVAVIWVLYGIIIDEKHKPELSK